MSDRWATEKGDSHLRAMLSGRFGAAAGTAAAPAVDPAPLARHSAGRRSAVIPTVRPAGAAAGLAILALAAGLVVVSGAPTVRVDRLRASAPPAVTFAGVSYRLVGVQRTRRIPQRGAAAIDASGVFEIVKLTLRAADRRGHLLSSDVLSLQAGATYYGVSSPDEIGLSDRQWGAAGTAIRLPAAQALTLKAVFDVPPAVAGRPTALHIGAFGYASQGAGETIALPDQTRCCRAAARPPPRREAPLGALVPSPVLGST